MDTAVVFFSAVIPDYVDLQTTIVIVKLLVIKLRKPETENL